MRRRLGKILVLMICFSILLPNITYASVQEEALDQLLEKRINQYRIPNVSVTILKQGELVYHRILGEGIDQDTRIYIGSTTKPFTALAVMQLVEQGKIDLDQRINAYLPEFTVSNEITVRHLLHHTSGMTEFGYMPFLPKEAGFEELIEDMNRMSITHQPGQQFSYFNQNYSLLGAIIERVSGQTYGNYLAENIFEPLGMNHTSAQGQVGIPGHIGFFGFSFKYQEPFINYDLPGGFLVSTTKDLTRYLEAVRTRRGELGVSAEGLDLMEEGRFYGMGWTLTDFAGRPGVHHGGSLPGFKSNAVILTEDEYSMALLTNKNHLLYGMFVYPQLNREIVSILTGDQQSTFPYYWVLNGMLLGFIVTIILGIWNMVRLIGNQKAITKRKRIREMIVGFSIPALLIFFIPLLMKWILGRGFTWGLAFLSAPDLILWLLIGMFLSLGEGLIHLYYLFSDKST